MARKSPRKAAAVVAGRLARVAETPVAPAWVVRSTLGQSRPADAGEQALPVLAALGREVDQVAALGSVLAELPPAWPADETSLLL